MRLEANSTMQQGVSSSASARSSGEQTTLPPPHTKHSSLSNFTEVATYHRSRETTLVVISTATVTLYSASLGLIIARLLIEANPFVVVRWGGKIVSSTEYPSNVSYSTINLTRVPDEEATVRVERKTRREPRWSSQLTSPSLLLPDILDGGRVDDICDFGLRQMLLWPSFRQFFVPIRFSHNMHFKFGDLYNMEIYGLETMESNGNCTAEYFDDETALRVYFAVKGGPIRATTMASLDFGGTTDEGTAEVTISLIKCTLEFNLVLNAERIIIQNLTVSYLAPIEKLATKGFPMVKAAGFTDEELKLFIKKEHVNQVLTQEGPTFLSVFVDDVSVTTFLRYFNLTEGDMFNRETTHVTN